MQYLLPVIFCLALVSVGAVLDWHAFNDRQMAQRIDFNRDVRPILNQNCTSCHGGVKRQGEVSFIYREEALGRGKSGRPTVVPGNPKASELIARVTSTDPQLRMPQHAPALPAQQIEVLRQWIREGAQWEDHWAFVPPKAQPLPAVKRAEWPRQPVDRFVLDRLEREGLQPSPEANKSALLRRASFDLTGLPPTAAELADFLADIAPDAYEKQIDRLLASPHYGERWAALWLDLARYADNRSSIIPGRHGRASWVYRDWVIDAFNRNVPYDRFVITQLAGDLLPNATFDDLVATSFQRQTLTIDGGDSDNEEFRMLAVMDRVATTWSVLNGLTINCVQCHSHPYDPLQHTDYYKFLAFYNSSRDADLPDDSPLLPIAEASRKDEVAQLYRVRMRLLGEVVAEDRRLASESAWALLPVQSASANERLGLQRAMDKLERLASAWGYVGNGMRKVVADATSYKLDVARRSASVPLKISRGEVWADAATPLLSAYELSTENLPDRVTALRIEVPPVNPDTARHTPEESFNVGGIEAWLVSPTGEEHAIQWSYFAFDSEENLSQALRETGSVKSAALGNVGGFASHSKLHQTRWMIAVPRSPLAIAPGTRLKMRITHTLRAMEPERRPDTNAAADWMKLAEAQARVTKNAELQMDDTGKSTITMRLRLTTTAEPRWTAIAMPGSALMSKRTELESIDRRIAQIPTLGLPVMAEQLSELKPHTLVFERGNMLTKTGPTLVPDVPGIFPKLPGNAPRNRLTMAQWFFGPQQPLTARVAVNRFWEQLFGVGIVETLEDFGSVGFAPSHPELLDWLALHFQNDLRWDMKALLRELVTSATYRQSATATAVMREKDPANRLLARGPRQRLTAEMVFDQALLSSGLLDLKLGGPPIAVPESAEDGASRTRISEHQGPHRRAIYVEAVRGSIYPSFVTFDAPDHQISLARRISTNTPQQALVTLNEPIHHEAAKAMARRLTQDPPAAGPGMTEDSRRAFKVSLNGAARSVLSRDLSPKELATLEAVYVDIQKMSSGPQKDLPALTAVAGVLLNLDAALTR